MTGLHGALCRAELLEALVRLSSYCFTGEAATDAKAGEGSTSPINAKKEKRSHTECFDDFVQCFL